MLLPAPEEGVPDAHRALGIVQSAVGSVARRQIRENADGLPVPSPRVCVTTAVRALLPSRRARDRGEDRSGEHGERRHALTARGRSESSSGVGWERQLPRLAQLECSNLALPFVDDLLPRALEDICPVESILVWPAELSNSSRSACTCCSYEGASGGSDSSK